MVQRAFYRACDALRPNKAFERTKGAALQFLAGAAAEQP